LDGWILRMANAYTKRANSVNPIYSFENNLEEKIQYCEHLYKENNLPVIFKIIDCEEHKMIDKKLEELHYDKIDVTSVQIYNGIKSVIHNKEQIFIDTEFSENWKNCFYSCNNVKDIKLMKTIEHMLGNIRHKIISIYKKEKGSFAGCGYGVIEKGFVGLFDIIVKEEFRGKGYGKEIVETLLSAAKELGATDAYLSVVNNNLIAKNMYEKIGFKETYKYWYRIKV
jgi:predicted GNAT family N-acyltransferase